MAVDQKALEILVAKEEIRELAQLYSRGVDRYDMELLKTLYAPGATDSHDEWFDGSAEDYIVSLANSLPHVLYSGHHICNHLIAVNGDEADGEVYALAYHAFPDGKGGAMEDFMAVRYIDNYAKQNGRWYFTRRVVTFDHRTTRPLPPPKVDKRPAPEADQSYGVLAARLFARGARA
jgi:hypothetical protein